jgi:uncharacterized protein YndB with AHSA1/START domain
MIDVTHQISTVERRVGSRTLEAGEARTITITRVYDTPLDDLWDACTNPERLPRWFLPISGDLRPGGRYEFQGNASGTIERCEPPHVLAATWEYGGETSGVELHLTPEPGGRTQFRLEHVAHVGDDLWAQFGPGAVGIGWDQAVAALTIHLAAGDETPTPEELQAWQATEDGLEFVRLASDRWAAASIAAGTDAAEAQAAAARTTGFYSGEPAA